jgi:hypothetical protein
MLQPLHLPSTSATEAAHSTKLLHVTEQKQSIVELVQASLACTAFQACAFCEGRINTISCVSSKEWRAPPTNEIKQRG